MYVKHTCAVCLLVSGSRKYYTGACLDPWKLAALPLKHSFTKRHFADQKSGALRWIASPTSAMKVWWCPCFCQFRQWKTPSFQGWRFQEFPPMDMFLSFFQWPSHMSKSCGCLFLDLAKAQQRLAMVCLSINISVHRTGPKPKAIPEATNAINQFWWWSVLKCYVPLKQTKGALNALQFDQKAKFQFPRPMPDAKIHIWSDHCGSATLFTHHCILSSGGRSLQSRAADASCPKSTRSWKAAPRKTSPYSYLCHQLMRGILAASLNETVSESEQLIFSKHQWGYFCYINISLPHFVQIINSCRFLAIFRPSICLSSFCKCPSSHRDVNEASRIALGEWHSLHCKQKAAT